MTWLWKRSTSTDRERRFGFFGNPRETFVFLFFVFVFQGWLVKKVEERLGKVSESFISNFIYTSCTVLCVVGSRNKCKI